MRMSKEYIRFLKTIKNEYKKLFHGLIKNDLIKPMEK